MKVLELSGSLNGTLASVRIAKFVSDTCGCELVTPKVLSSDSSRFLKEDLLVIPNLPKLCIKNPTMWEETVATANVVVWVQNDFSIAAPPLNSVAESLFSRAFTRRIREKKKTVIWTTCPDRFPRHYREYVNWNVLAYEPTQAPPPTKGGVLYYGACRPGRHKDFRRYFSNNELFTVSTAAPGKFKELLPELKTIPPLDSLQRAEYAAGLYIEDEQSHRQYHSPANRIYEMLSIDQAILVDHFAVKTLTRGGFEVPDCCIVSHPSDVHQALENLEEIRAAQRGWGNIAHGQLQEMTQMVRSLRERYCE